MQTMNLKKRNFWVGIAIFLGLIVTLPQYATGGDSSGCTPFDKEHSAFTDLLQKHVRNGKVNYQGLKADQAALDAYVSQLESVCKMSFSSWKPNDKQAFFINAYNAYTLRLVLKYYPITTIQKVPGGDAWQQKSVSLKNLFGKKTTLHHLENNIIRKRFKDPRIHFALNCASNGCPDLQNRAYLGTQLNRQLQRVTTSFLANANHNRFNADTSTLYLSKIFDWYKGDFGGDRKLVAYFMKYAPKVVKEQLAQTDATQIKVVFNEYDWRLNK